MRTRMRTRVLVVDDDRDFRRIMRAILEDVGYTVLEASDGTSALAQLAEQAGDIHAHGMIVLLDLLMPGMNGVDVLRTLAHDGQRANRHAYIVVTAMDTRALSVDVLQHLIQLDAPLLQKPFRFDELLEEIEAAAQRLTPLPRSGTSDA